MRRRLQPLPGLSDLIHMPMMTDESVVTLEDAEYLVRNDPVDFFYLLINKNAVFWPRFEWRN